MNVAVLGLGYIGLPTAAMLTRAGHVVVGIDPDRNKLDDIVSGCRHVGEEEVRQLACDALASSRFSVADNLVSRADAYIICVPTPTTNRRPDLHHVEEAAAQVARHAASGALIIVESTVPPGTVENIVVKALLAAGKSPDVMHIAHCPERVIPGSIAFELRHNARVIGGRRPIDAERVRELYASFCEGDISITDCLTAELVKVVENTYRDVNLAFANELAILSQALGADVWEVIRLANKHPRVNVLRPGPGVGGHCIPVDPNFLSNANPFITELIQTARRINERMPHLVIRLIDEALGTNHAAANIALLGAAYKAGVDDTRESPALDLVRLLLERGHNVTVYDPLAQHFEHALSPSIEDAAAAADALVLVTDHPQFRSVDPMRIAPLVRQRNLIDTRNILDRDQWSAAGFTVRTLGVPAPRQLAQPVRIA